MAFKLEIGRVFRVCVGCVAEINHASGKGTHGDRKAKFSMKGESVKRGNRVETETVLF